jgi:hypothetical protein
MLYMSLNTTQSPQQRLIPVAPQSRSFVHQTQYILHHSLDKRHPFFHVVCHLFLGKPHIQQKVGIFMEIVHSFSSKSKILKIRQLFGFLNWKMPGTHGICVVKVKK